ncbi:hypothetical protein ACFL6E_00490 [Candidatus Neomarinimicrobiota bacterium]
MGRYISLSIALELLISGILFGQTEVSPEIAVLSKYVGSSIEIPEQQYYDIFDNIDGFIKGQFRATADGFKANIRSEKGWIVRHFTSREFYDMGLAIDLAGPIDTLVFLEMSGTLAYAALVDTIKTLPKDVYMSLSRAGDKQVTGYFRKFDGQNIHMEKRFGKPRAVPLNKMTRIWYRDPPIADAQADMKITGYMILAGMMVGEGVNLALGTSDYEDRWQYRFAGGVGALTIAPAIMKIGRIRRAETHTMSIGKDIQELIRVYWSIYVE